jgi:hypothetical protein
VWVHSAKLWHNKCGVYLERPTLPLVEEETPFPNTKTILEITKVLSWVMKGPKTNNDCAGKDSSNLLDWTGWELVNQGPKKKLVNVRVVCAPVCVQ